MTAPRPQPPHLALYLPGAALTILSVVALTFVVHLTVISHLEYERSQQTAYADFRIQLAEATAPSGQTNEDGKLVRPGTAVAVLRIPYLGLQTVVFEGTSADVLEAGPGHRRDTVLPGQSGTSVIMGRRAAYGGPMFALGLLLPQSQMNVITGQGEHEYRVIAVRRAGEEAPPPAEAAVGRLVLITADGPAYLPRNVFYVYAELITPAQPTARRKFGAASLPPAERPMAMDHSAWVPLVLWGQALVIAALALAWFRARRGGWQAWLVGAPVLGAIGLSAADQAARLLPNLM